MPTDQLLLGEFTPPLATFAGIEAKIAHFNEKTFRDLSSRHRFRLINSHLLDLLQKSEEGHFLLSALLDYIRQVNELKVYEEQFTLSHFEFWLNLFSELSPAEKLLIRGKIVGKQVPRDAYQLFFPIGMGKSYAGSHFVAAHLSPDIDTTVASFWGWVDAFGARVGEALHLWCLPGGPSDASITRLFEGLFGTQLFGALARTSKTLTLTAQDLLTQQGMSKTKGHVSTYDLDHTSEKALVYVDDAGYYLGDWRAEDIEVVRQVGNAFKSLLHLFENGFHIGIISLFSKESLSVKNFPPFLHSLFGEQLSLNTSVKELGSEGKETFSLFLKDVLNLGSSLQSTFGELLDALGKHGIEEAPLFKREVESLPASSLFDSDGNLIENRTAIFHVLEKLIELLDIAIRKGRGLVDRLDIVMEIKEKVLHIPSSFLTMKSDVEEIRQKMRYFNTLTVVIPEEEGRLFPVGVVRAVDLRKETLGTVSLRDFSNFQEVQMAPYLQVISVIDHHKIDLKTLSQPQIIVGDAQSCNVLIAEVEFKINDTYSLGGMSEKAINQQLDELKKAPFSSQTIRLMERVLKRKAALEKGDLYSVSKEREWAEYMSFLHAILDDTDLLSKVSDRDIVVVASLLNRMKSLTLGREVEIIDLSDLPKDSEFAKKGAERILKHPDMYSIYKKIYSFREEEVEENMRLSAEGLPSTFFADTKEQNGCCRVGQTKLFATNFDTYSHVQFHLKEHWVKEAEERSRNHPSLDLFLHMVSTVPNADSVFKKGDEIPKNYSDELWFYIPGTPESELHLGRFLSGFQTSKEAKNNQFSIELLGGKSALYEEIFKRDFLSCPILRKESHPALPIAVLKFKPGSVNSRKSAITPFLPRQI